MEQGFIDILKKIVDKHGKEYFLDTKKCKAIVSDYTGSEYRIERGLLLRAVEALASNAIFSAEKADLESCMKVQQRNLQEEQFMDSAIAWNIVYVLAHVLRDIGLEVVQADSKDGVKDFDEAVSFYYNDQFDKAFPIFEALAKENHAGAQYYLGVCYALGEGVEKNEIKFNEWIRKAADQGYAKAQVRIGTQYLNGWGVPEDETKAIEWIRKAVDQGDAEAQRELGYWYLRGQGVPKDYAKAIEWYRKAAEQGDVKAQLQLAYCFYGGEGAEQNLVKAVKWYRKAAEQGDEYAREMVKELENDDDNGGENRFSAPNAKILIVDDSRINRSLIKDRLLFFNIKIDECENGEKAVEKIKTNRYDLVFMADFMPWMSGTEATKCIRGMGNTDPYFKNLPIIACDKDSEKKEVFIKDGFNDFLPRPWELEQLDAILVKWLPKEKQK